MTVHHAISEALLRTTVGAFSRHYWRVHVSPTSHFPPEGPCFIYGNHSNNYDPFILNALLPWGQSTSGVLTQEYMRGGIIAYVFRNIGLLATRKSVPEPSLIKQIYRKLEQGHKVVIYPEGGRRWDGRPAPWITSTAKLFVKAGVPVYPILTHGSYVGWPRWATYPRPARIQLEIGDPLQFDRKTPLADALSALKKPIDLDENIVPEAIKPRRAHRPADGIHRLLYRDPFTGEGPALYTTDGTAVRNAAGTVRLRMLPDSTLVDEKTEQVYLTGDLYARIKALPLEKHPDGTFLESHAEVHVEHTFPKLDPVGTCRVLLYDDALLLDAPGDQRRILLEDILYVGIERNSKLQLFLSDQMVQLYFKKEGSALQWSDTLHRLKATQTPSPTDLSTA